METDERQAALTVESMFISENTARVLKGNLKIIKKNGYVHKTSVLAAPNTIGHHSSSVYELKKQCVRFLLNYLYELGSLTETLWQLLFHETTMPWPSQSN